MRTDTQLIHTIFHIVTMVRTKRAIQFDSLKYARETKTEIKLSKEHRERAREFNRWMKKKYKTKQNVFTVKCKNSFIINMNNYHSLRVGKRNIQLEKSLHFAHRHSHRHTHARARESGLNRFNNFRCFIEKKDKKKIQRAYFAVHQCFGMSLWYQVY